MERKEDIKKRIQQADDGVCNRRKIKSAQEDRADAVQSLMWDHDMTKKEAEQYLNDD